MSVVLAVLGLTSLLMVLGMVGAEQASSVRRTIECVHVKRLLDMAAGSAFEEVCAILEARFPPVVLVGNPEGNDTEPQLNENQMDTFHDPVDPVITRSSFAENGVQISPVSVLSSPWKVFELPARDGVRMGTAFGLVELAVRVSVRVGPIRTGREVTVRRYVTVHPEPGARAAPILIQPNNLVVLVKEA